MLLNGQVDFTDDGKAGFMKQIVIGENATGDGIFDGHNTGISFSFFGRLDYFAECRARQNANLFSKKLSGRYLVKTSFETLYGYNACHETKNPGFCAGISIC